MRSVGLASVLLVQDVNPPHHDDRMRLELEGREVIDADGEQAHDATPQQPPDSWRSTSSCLCWTGGWSSPDQD